MSSGTSFASSQGTRSSRSAEDCPDLRAQMEKRRKRRKESNRESARRSRVRKQQHLDDLSSQVDQLKNQSQQLSMVLGMTTQNLVALQAQNSVMQTQKMELESRLCALGEIICCMNSITNAANPAAAMGATASGAYDIFGAGSTWSQPID
ncbi:bZIP transcription factor 44-like [Triticum dicoccoides]|uniref:bZIP transcription factor 44-like n=1 Tax=Triticum dicoccoides TaxID=85692 RepID=UPI001890CEBF|nr:bZIP transcription factor 44-like [Triticum dicoccoides]